MIGDTMNAAQQWLDSHNITLAPSARRRFTALWADIETRYTDDAIRQAVLTAAAQYLAGQTGAEDLRKLGAALARSRAKVDRDLAVARALTVLAVGDGKSENSTAKDLGVDRMAIRDWLGKR